jgi:integron integrase
LFLYHEVLHREIDLVFIPTARRPDRLPTVLTHAEALRVIDQLDGTYRLMAQLLYGSGLRLSECLRLRVKDLDFSYRTITVRDGKGAKDRVTPLPDAVIPDLKRQIERARLQHEEDLLAGSGEVYLPDALQRKYPGAAKELIWQFVFFAPNLSSDPRSGRQRRYHIDSSALQRAVRKAAHNSGLKKRVTCHTFRHSFATHSLQNGYDIRTAQESLGHKVIRTTMIYTHVLQRGGLAVRSPLDE